MFAIPALFVAPLSAFVAYGYFREGDARSGVKASAACVVALALYLLAQDGGNVKIRTEGCYKDWDGRSNSLVCD